MSSFVRADDLREVKELLWTSISSKLHPSEHDLVRNVVGPLLFERNEQVFEEVSTLAEILGDVRVTNDAEFNRRRILANPARSLVEEEIRQLVTGILRANSALEASCAPDTQGPTTTTASSSSSASKPSALLPTANPRQKTILDTVAASATLGREGTPRTPPSRPLSSRSSRTGLSEEGSTCSSLAQQEIQAVVEPIKSKVNALDVDTVRGSLVQALELEHETLLNDVEYFHMCLEGETDLTHQIQQPPPSVGELRQLGTELESIFVQAENRAEHHHKVKKMMEAEDKASGRVGRLRSLVGVSREADGEKSFLSASMPSVVRPASPRSPTSTTGSAEVKMPHPPTSPKKVTIQEPKSSFRVRDSASSTTMSSLTMKASRPLDSIGSLEQSPRHLRELKTRSPMPELKSPSKSFSKSYKEGQQSVGRTVSSEM